jgi:hypothetical protein
MRRLGSKVVFALGGAGCIVIVVDEFVAHAWPHGHPDPVGGALWLLGDVPPAMFAVRAMLWLLGRGRRPTPWFWSVCALTLLNGVLGVAMLGRNHKAIIDLVVIALFIIDWWWGSGPGRRKRKQIAATVLKTRRALAWGIEAKRPIPA